MTETPLYFDSCTHPTLDGMWIDGRYGMTFKQLDLIRRENSGYEALAIGLPGVGGYEHRAFKRECDSWGFEGVAAVTTVESADLEREFNVIADLGFRGVKVHPRLLKKNTDLSYLSRVFSLCDQFGLVCLLCTYEADQPGQLPSCDPFYQVCSALNDAPNVRLILMHGGGPRLIQFASLARHSESILIDLSFTIIDSMTTALKPSIRDLVSRLDRHLCVGTDSPEFKVEQVLHRVLEIAENLETMKLQNILSKNLLRFFPHRTQ